MPFVPPKAKPKSPEELAAERSIEEAEEAIRLDRNPDLEGLEPSNLTIAEDFKPSLLTVHDYRLRSKELKAKQALAAERQTLIDKLKNPL